MGRLRRTLKRGAGFRRIEEGDWPWLWSAYKTGAFDRLFETLREAFGVDDSDITPAEFRQTMDNLMSVQEGVTFFVLEANVPKRGIAPVGLVSAAVNEFRLEPHVIWFRWASARNKLEAALKFLWDMGEKRQIVIYTEEDHTRFYTQVARYGPIRKVGKIRHFFGPGRAAMVWSSGKEPDLSDVE